jgi:inner membrane protein
MPSPIAHTATGYFILRCFCSERQLGPLSRREWLICLGLSLLIANGPDLDLIPQFLTGERYHHGFTHSLTFALWVSVLFGIGVSRVWPIGFRSVFVLGFMLSLSHPLLDFFTQGGKGIELFWPISSEFLKSPVWIFPDTHYTRALFHPSHVAFIAFESCYAALLCLGWRMFERKLDRCRITCTKS